MGQPANQIVGQLANQPTNQPNTLIRELPRLAPPRLVDPRVSGLGRISIFPLLTQLAPPRLSR